MDRGSRPLIASIFERFPRGRVLDFGGGDGQLATMIQSKGHRATVMDFDPALVDAARGRGLEGVVGDEAALDKMVGEFDHALLGHVVEHVQCPHETLLPRVHNAVKPGGRVVVAVPNAARLRNRLAMLLGTFSDGMVYQHVRFFTRDTLREELTKGGLRVLEEHGHAYGGLTAAASRLSPNFGDELVFVCERPAGPPRAIPTTRVWQHS